VGFNFTTTGLRSATLTLGNPVLASVPITATAQAPLLATSTANLTFPTTTVGQSSTQSFTVTNTSGTSQPVSFVMADPSDSAFSIPPSGLGSACGAVLAAGATCTLTVLYQPTVPGTQVQHVILLTGTPPVTQLSVRLSGTGSAAGLAVNPTSLPLGSTPTGIGFGIPIAVTNNGTVSVALVPAFTGPDAALFQVVVLAGTPSPCAPTTTLAPGAACTLMVGFTFTTTGNKSATLTLGNPVLASVPITATAVPPTLTTSTTSLIFPTTTIGQSSTQSFTVTNTSSTSQPLSFVMADGSTSPFSFPSSGLGSACGAVLAAGATCSLSVRYQPTVAGLQVQQVILSTGTPPLPQVAVVLNGTGSAAGLTVSPTSGPLGNVATGLNLAVAFTVNNIGSVAVPLVPAFTGPDAGQFQVVVPAGTTSPCVPTTTLAPGASCTLSVAFNFTTTGAKSATVTLGNPVLASVPLTATAVTPALRTSVPSLTFQPQTVGTAGTQALTVTNTTAATVALTIVTADGSSSPFSIQTGLSGACGATLAANASCSLTIRYLPGAVGVQTEQILLSTGGTPPALQAVVALSGTGR
jgi:hypothetical protein